MALAMAMANGGWQLCRVGADWQRGKEERWRTGGTGPLKGKCRQWCETPYCSDLTLARNRDRCESYPSKRTFWTGATWTSLCAVNAVPEGSICDAASA
jgi:hypothetical protein